MKITITILVSAVFLAGVMLTNDQSLAQDACGEGANSYKLMIHVSENRPTRVTHQGEDATDFYVCNGDEVEWQVVGSDKQFWVDFVNGSPFSGGEKKSSNNNGKISVTIGGEAQSYKYDIGIVDGEVLDPKIIIQD